jgi:filamentous hemagglutinin family protein
MHRKQARLVHCLGLGLFLFLPVPFAVSLAQTITPSGLNTTVSAPIVSMPSGNIQINITDGTRPGGGANLFHGFGEFNVPTNTTANFLNNTGLPTSNILGRITGGNLSSIYGTIQTTGFGNANLFLMNPAGFLFGPNATVNVGGMVTFTSADYLRLTDGARFNAIPNASADAILSAAPVAAFGFLGSNPGAITVQGSQLTVAEATGISVVGGNITVQGGTFAAPSGQINLVSVGKPSKPNVGGEVVVTGSGQGIGFNPTGFRSLGTITLSQGSTVDVSSNEVFPSNGLAAGSVLIRGGQFVMENSSIEAVTELVPFGITSGDVEVTADQIVLLNSRIDTSTHEFSPAGNITFNANTFSSTDSVIQASAPPFDVAAGGAITIQGLQGLGTNAHAVSITNSQISTSSVEDQSGPVTVRGDKISLDHATVNAASGNGNAGSITLASLRHIGIQDSEFMVHSVFGFGGTIDLQAGTRIDLTNTTLSASGAQFGFVRSGLVTMAAPTISLRGSTVGLGFFSGPVDTISITGTKAVCLTNGTALTGGTILINGGAQFTSQQSTISATGFSGNGGVIQMQANKIALTDTEVNTSTSGGPESVGGTITLDAKNTTLTNSQILSTATEGAGGTINITSPVLSQTGSVIDASSQSGTNGTVTINGVVQP